MTPDELIGKRIAELREHAELRQEDLLFRMEARGVSWTRTVLSRIESGQRSLKASEAFVVAAALGTDPADLDPRGVVQRRIESLHAQWRQESNRAKSSALLSNSIADDYVALSVFARLSENPASAITVYGQVGEMVSRAWIAAGSPGIDNAHEPTPSLLDRRRAVAEFWQLPEVPEPARKRVREAEESDLDGGWSDLMRTTYPNLEFAKQRIPLRRIESDQIQVDTVAVESLPDGW